MSRCWTDDDAANFIQKPFSIDEFTDAIERVLKSGREKR